MIRLIATLICLTLMSPVMVAAETKVKTLEDLVSRDGRFFRKFSDVPFSGDIKEGTAQGSIRDGKLEGKFTTYHPNGQLKGIVHFKNGEWEGEFRTYDSYGILKETGEIYGKNSAKFVKYKYGNISSERQYKNDVLDGKQIDYFSSRPHGRIEREENYKLGKKHGLSTSYFPNGKILRKAFYESGSLNGSYIEYFENGTVKEKGNYKDGVRDGVWEFFDAPGKKRFGPSKPISKAELHKQIEIERERLKGKDSKSFPWESDPIVEPGPGKKASNPSPWASLPVVESVLGKDEGSGVYKDGKKISP